MVLVKDVSALHETCARASNIAQNILDGSVTLKNNMQVRIERLTAEATYSTTLVADATTKVAILKAEVATLIAGLPETAGALASTQAQLQIAISNLALMEQRCSLANELNMEFMAFYEENANKLNASMGRFNDRVDLLNARINHATNALENYFNASTTQGSVESIKQKSQYFEYQKLLYNTNKASIKDIENAYIDKLNAKKDSFIASKNIGALGVEMSKYNMPEFESSFETKISINDFDKERYVHDKIANKALKEAITNNDELKNIFDSRQLQQIENDITPDGYTWHHDGNPPPGRMQLVDSYLHNALRHTGGYSLWCERA